MSDGLEDHEASFRVLASSRSMNWRYTAPESNSDCFPFMRRAVSNRCPVHNLPAEILSDIFLHVCEFPLDAAPDQYPLAAHRYISPIDLSHVCQYWRNVALSRRHLWTFIFVSVAHEHHIDRIDAFLERSKECPLDISISFLPSQDLHSAEDMDWKFFCELRDVLVDKTLEWLIGHSSRWKSFELHVETAGLMFDILRRLN